MYEYRINKSEYDDIHPEETLADGLSGYSSVEVPVSQGVFGVVYLLLGIMFAAIIFQAINLQIVNGVGFSEEANSSRFHTYPVPGARGAVIDRNGKPVVQNVPAFDLVLVKSEFDIKNADRLSALIGERVSIADQGVIALRKDIPKELAIAIQSAKLSGVYLVSSARRDYVNGPAMAHVLGYTGEVTREEVESDSAYQAGNLKGRAGVESFYEKYLRSPLERIPLSPDYKGQKATAQINTVRLTVDADAQKHLYDSITAVFKEQGVRRGAAIAQDVRTGEILGLVSIPSFDPNNIDQKVFEDSRKPLFNRAVSGLYSPGSTIKPLYGLAGLKEKIVTPSTLVFANGSIEVPSEVDPNKTYVFRDWKVHGWTDLRKAIAWSVDVYYYALGGGYENIAGLGIDRIEKYLRLFRADQETGIDLPAEVAGFVPSKKWKKENRGEPWYLGDTYNISIGQGDLQVTPIWLSTYVGAIANGGRMMKPFIVSSITNGDKEIYAKKPEVAQELPFDTETVRVVQEGMRQTITDGTAQMLNDLPVKVAAKTGTAQTTGQNLNSLFITYGPYDNPEISITVLAEQISGSQSVGVMVAKKFYEWYFNKRL